MPRAITASRRLPRWVLPVLLIVACSADRSALEAVHHSIGLGLTAFDRDPNRAAPGRIVNRDESLLQVDATDDARELSLTGLAVGTARVSFRSAASGCLGPSSDHDTRVRVAPVTGADPAELTFDYANADPLVARPDLGPLVVGMTETVPVRYRDSSGAWLAGGGRTLRPMHADIAMAERNQYGDDQIAITPTAEGAVEADVDVGDGLVMQVRYEGVAPESLRYEFDFDPESSRVQVHARTPEGIEVRLDPDQLVLSSEGERMWDHLLPAGELVPVCAAVVGHEVCANLRR